MLLAALSACNRGNQSKDAVRQGVMEYLSGKTSSLALNMSAMNVDVTSVTFNGTQADASVSITPKSAPGGGMSVNYHLEQQGSKWVVMGRKDAGGTPHGGGAVPGGAMPGAENPHGGGAAPGADNPHGAAPSGAGSGKMPSPDDLPPTGKKK
ncbi:hypothetical protein SBA3_4740003 [Candidatus Sulfopaludibacter sp. SbA3]|nr:hypothetical protein SBA3_4740003 [Candidatus Sulfopaludibacter sp. SbA3]